MANIIIVGSGIIGISSAYYLQQQGHHVTIIDKTDASNNCSYGNAGYICPSHFVPLATPGIVKQGLKWMFNSSSPFYVEPRLNWQLIDWGIKFIKSANAKQVEAAAIPLRDLALLSQHEYVEWTKVSNTNFSYEHKGLLEIFKTTAKQEHAKHLVHQAHELGLTNTVLLNAEELQAREPQTKVDALGAVYFACDAHVYPNKLMQQMIGLLKQKGVQFILNEEVIGFEKKVKNITEVITAKNNYKADAVIICTGSWSKELIKKLNVYIPLVAGRGYSVTLDNSPYKLNYPSILMEGRVAITPMDGNKIRFGGTMEITGTTTPPKIKRVEGILRAVKNVFPDFDIATPPLQDIWYGYRPCSADGLPYIGKTKKYNNLVIATGHSMLGLSLGAGTGKLVSQIINEEKTSINIDAFQVERF